MNIDFELQTAEEELQDLESKAEQKRVEIKHLKELKSIHEERNDTFLEAILAQLRDGNLEEVVALEMCEVAGIEATEKIEQAALQAKPAEIAQTA